MVELVAPSLPPRAERGDAAADRALINAGLASFAESARHAIGGRLGDAVAYALGGPGKRIRGLLCVSAYRACGGTDDVVPLACAVEAVHAYSLVHDDLPCMDDDDIRRGRLTAHREFDVPTATRAGVMMIPLSAQYAFSCARQLGLDPPEAAEIVGILMRASGAAGMVGGQLLDLDAEGQVVSLDELQRIHRLKTGDLIAASLVIGGAAARASVEQRASLGRFGDLIGLAFQIADDVLDVTSTTAQLGKSAGRDAILRKSTYPALMGLNEARAYAAQLVSEAEKELAEAAGGLRSDTLVSLARFAVERSA